MKTPIEQYRLDIKSGKIKPDAAQKMAIEELQRITIDLHSKQNSRKHLFMRFQSNLVKGLYMWGGVGRGKTYMMDLFFKALPFKEKRRQHFNRFMEDVHKRLNLHQGQKDPLKIIAKEIAAKTIVICFDEFVVEDIADAMVLGLLFKYLFKEGVCLVATSNREPNELYKDGLKREQFLPAIKAIEDNTVVLNVDSGKDYRDTTESATYYHTPLTKQAQFMNAHFARFQGDSPLLDNALIIHNREIDAIKHCRDAVWFEFSDICNAPRSKADYIELADSYKAVLLGNIPQMDESMDDYCRRFVSLVDELYDNEIELIISAMVPAEHLYTGSKHKFIFKRTVSRLK